MDFPIPPRQLLDVLEPSSNIIGDTVIHPPKSCTTKVLCLCGIISLSALFGCPSHPMLLPPSVNPLSRFIIQPVITFAPTLKCLPCIFNYIELVDDKLPWLHSCLKTSLKLKQQCDILHVSSPLGNNCLEAILSPPKPIFHPPAQLKPSQNGEWPLKTKRSGDCCIHSGSKHLTKKSDCFILKQKRVEK